MRRRKFGHWLILDLLDCSNAFTIVRKVYQQILKKLTTRDPGLALFVAKRYGGTPVSFFIWRPGIGRPSCRMKRYFACFYKSAWLRPANVSKPRASMRLPVWSTLAWGSSTTSLPLPRRSRLLFPNSGTLGGVVVNDAKATGAPAAGTRPHT